jgi:hypothetical protein
MAAADADEVNRQQVAEHLVARAKGKGVGLRGPARLQGLPPGRCHPGEPITSVTDAGEFA